MLRQDFCLIPGLFGLSPLVSLIYPGARGVRGMEAESHAGRQEVHPLP